MNTSETIGAIAAALAAAQGELTDPAAEGVNPHFRSRYARLEDALPGIRGVLSRHGLAFLQSAHPADPVLLTRVVHKSGEWIEGSIPLTLDRNPQKQGSALTYARRYALFALLGLAADTDDDGNGASAKRPAPAPAPAPEPPHRWPDADRAWFCGRLKGLDYTYEHAAAFAEAQGWGRPSAWKRPQLERFVARAADWPELAEFEVSNE